MTERDTNNEKKPGLKRLGLRIIVEPTDNIELAKRRIELTKWQVMKSIICTAVMAGAIKLDVKETENGTEVEGYMCIEDGLELVPIDKHNRPSYKDVREAKKKYPFLDSILKATIEI